MAESFEFKTGKQLQEETLRALIERASAPFQSHADPVHAGFGSAAAAIGAGLAHGFFNRDKEVPIAAGDIDTSDIDISTSEGALEYSQRLYKAGFTDEAIQLQDRGMKLKEFEDKELKAGGKMGKDGKLKAAAPVTGLQLDGVRDRFIQNPDYSELVVETLESDDAMAKAGFNVMLRNISSDVNEVVRDLEAQGQTVSRADVEALLVDTTLEAGAIGEKGILFWKSPVMDRKKHEAARQATKEAVYKSFMGEPEAKEEPVKVAPHQQATQTPEAPAEPTRDIYDVQGSIQPDAPMTAEPLAKPVKLSKSDRQTVDAINGNIQKLMDQGQTEGSPAVQALIATRDRIFNRYTR